MAADEAGNRRKLVMIRKISVLSVLAVVLLCSCADKTTPEYTVKEFISSVKNDNEQEIVNMMDFERILVQVKGPAYSSMTPEEKNVEMDRLIDSTMKALRVGELSDINKMTPVVVKTDIVKESSGPKAVVVVSDKADKKMQYAFVMSQMHGKWKIFRILRKPA